MSLIVMNEEKPDISGYMYSCENPDISGYIVVKISSHLLDKPAEKINLIKK